MPQTVISEGQALARHIAAPDIHQALKLAYENEEDLELVKWSLSKEMCYWRAMRDKNNSEL